MQYIYENSSVVPNLIAVNPIQKRLFSATFQTSRWFGAMETALANTVEMLATDFGPVRFVVSRAVPQSEVLFLNTDLIAVVPLIRRSFYSKQIAEAGDNKRREVIGEYTLEFRNELAHARLGGLALT